MLLIAAATLLASRGLALFRDEPRFPRDVAVAYAAWMLLAVASVAWSADRQYTLSELRAEMLYGTLAFLVFFYASTDAVRWRQCWSALMAGTLLVLAGALLQAWLPVEISRHPVDGGAGAWSTHLVLIAPLLLVLAWPPPWGRGGGTLILSLALCVLLIAAWDTENRIVWAALGAELTLCSIANFSPPVEARRARNCAPRRHRRGPGGDRLRDLLVGATSATFRRSRHHHEPGAARPVLWARMDEIQGRAVARAQFGREILAEEFLPYTPKTPGHPLLRHAHNTLVDIALELGIAGLAAFVALLLALSRHYWRFLRDPAVAPLGIIGLALIAGFLTKNLTDDFLHRHNALVFWALNAMLLGLGRRARPPA